MRIIALLIISFSFFTTFGQVGINTTTPSTITDLDVKNIVNGTDTIPRGIMIPRMSESLRNKIDVSSSNDPNSLLIYNTTEDCYNYYSKSDAEWKSLCGANGKAVFTIDCSTVAAKGLYSNDLELDATNYIEMTVTVTKAGSYNITGLPSVDNGYYFSLSGEFAAPGKFKIVLPGSGTPTKSTPSGEKGDQIVISSNGIKLCDNLYIEIQDSSIKPGYSITCVSARTNGTYAVGTALTSANTIQLEVVAASYAAGARYVISTNTLNGYSFYGSGTLVSGNQTVTLYATGTPLTNQTDDFILSSNTTFEGGSSCAISVKVATRAIKILGASNTDYYYQIGATNSLINQALYNADYFGNNQTAIYPVSSFSFKQIYSNSARFAPNISSFDPDIIFVQYNFCEYMNDEDITALTDFVNSGGALIFCTDGDNAVNVRNVISQKLCRSIFDNNTTLTVSDVESNDIKYNTKVIKNTGTMVTNGPFMDLNGLSMGRDGGNNIDFNITGFPYDTGTVIAFGSSDNSAIFAFMHQKKGFVFIGDGGPFTAAPDRTTEPYNWPAKFNIQNGKAYAVPNIYSTPISYNSFLFLNIMAWAINHAQKNK